MIKSEKSEKLMWVLKSLLASYIVTGLLLLLLTFLLYQFDLDEQKVMVGIIVTYVLSTFVGGFLIGKLTGAKKFVWGLVIGAVYFLLLFLISFGVYREFNTNGTNLLTTILLCLGGGMLGGMLS